MRRAALLASGTVAVLGASVAIGLALRTPTRPPVQAALPPRLAATIGPVTRHVVVGTRARIGVLRWLQRHIDVDRGISPETPLHSVYHAPGQWYDGLQAPAQYDTIHVTAPRWHPQDQARAEMPLDARGVIVVGALENWCANVLDAGALPDGAPLGDAGAQLCTVVANMPATVASLPEDWGGDGGRYWWCDGGPTCEEPPDLPDDADGGSL